MGGGEGGFVRVSAGGGTGEGLYNVMRLWFGMEISNNRHNMNAFTPYALPETSR